MSAPPAPTENTDTLLDLEFAVASSPPPGLNATDSGNDPVVNGEPATGVSAPPAPTENTDTVLSASFAVASRLPSGLNATENPPPFGNGEPVTGVSAPSAPTENTETLPALSDPLTKFAVASSFPSGLNATEGVHVAPGSPAGNGEPGTGVSAPPAPTENTDTLPPQ